MEVIMSSVHESSSMENEGSKCPDKPTISKKKNRRTKWTPERRYNKRQRDKENRSLYYRENPDASTVSKGVEDTKATDDMTEPDNDASKKRKREKRKKKNKTLSTKTISKDSTKILEGIAGSTGAVKLNSKQKHKQRQRQLRRTYNLFAIGFQKQQLDQKQAKSTGFQTQVKADLKKKLLILDVNGVLAHVVYGKIDGADHYTPNDSIFKRPHLDSFLEFCFERFNVGIWSTKQYKNLVPVVEFLLPNWKEKLLFIWDGSKSTKTKKNTVDNKKKPIQFKHLGKFWESNGPCKSWVKGNFNKSNTLLVDDSPYKALLNPKNTAIFPSSYNHLHKESDDLLGTNGNMRGYLEGVAKCEHVQKHVQQHPFGQPAMDENHQHWDIYKTAADSIHTPKNRLIHRPTSYPIYCSFNHSYRRNQWRN